MSDRDAVRPGLEDDATDYPEARGPIPANMSDEPSDLTTEPLESTQPEQPGAAAPDDPAGASAPGKRGPSVRLGAVIALAIAAGLVAWLVFRDNGSSSTSRTTPTTTAGTAKPLAVSEKGMRTIAGLGVPIYWAGARSGSTYEMTKTTDDRVLIRYLPAGTKVGASGTFLTVGTYPMKNAFTITSGLARGSGAVAIPIGHGAVAFYSKKTPTNVYVAYPGSNYQIEVYDPTTRAAQQLVFSGQIVPVVGGKGTKPAVPTAASPADLKAASASLGHPIYWAGSTLGQTYELTQAWNGNVYVRYLPAGVKVGTKTPYLTVATYPVLNALAAVRRTAATSTAHTINLPDGGLAVVDDRYPRSIHLAYPNSDYQVEVFDPSATRGRQLVTSGKIVPFS